MNYTKKELRYWLNWIFVILVTPLYTVTQLGISSSFHQYVTNPIEELEENETTEILFEPGLGETELFYSLLISTTEFGALLSGLASGFLVKCVPYWYMFLFALVSHTVAFIIYCLAPYGWLMIISRLLTGYFAGSVFTLAFSYCTTSSEEYVMVKKELGKEVDDKEQFRLRNYLFTAISFGHSTGTIIGGGMAAIFAQFESVDQFRAIGWFNVAYGVALICLLVLMFRGEYKCKSKEQCMQFCPNKEQMDTKISCGLLPLFVILSMILLSMIERVRFSFLLTLFNPIASDSFGVDEKGGSYLLLILSILHVAGPAIVIILQRLRMSSQGILLLSIFSTMFGYLIVTDWQTIPYDPCTEYSPFHHPNSTFVAGLQKTHFPSHSGSVLTNITFAPELKIDLGAGFSLHYSTDLDVNFNCKPTEYCDCGQTSSRCLRYPVNRHNVVNSFNHSKQANMFECNSSFSGKSPVTFCVSLYHENNKIQKTTVTPTSEVNRVNIHHQGVDPVARNNCIHANVTSHQCHWIPDSEIFKKECEDCPPICRSVHQTLTFAQFIIGCGLLLLSSSAQMVPISSLLMNQSPEQTQGIVLGSATAGNSISRAVSPLFWNTAYEGMEKRLFVATILLAIVHIPFIIEIIVLYPKLGPRTKQEDSKDSYKFTKLESVDKDYSD